MYLCHFHLRLSFDVFKTFKILHFSNFTSFNPVISIYLPHSILIPEWSLNHFNSKCSALQGVAGSTHVLHICLTGRGSRIRWPKGKKFKSFTVIFPVVGQIRDLIYLKMNINFIFVSGSACGIYFTVVTFVL